MAGLPSEIIIRMDSETMAALVDWTRAVNRATDAMNERRGVPPAEQPATQRERVLAKLAYFDPCSPLLKMLRAALDAQAPDCKSVHDEYHQGWNDRGAADRQAVLDAAEAPDA